MELSQQLMQDLMELSRALNACCTNINSEFQQTWSILGAGFNGTFCCNQQYHY